MSIHNTRGTPGTGLDAEHFTSRRDAGIDGLSLFADVPEEPTPIQTPAPSAPGSATSREAAESIDHSGKRQHELRRVLVWFAAQSEPRTRHQLADALYPETGGLGSACGRVNDLVFAGWLEEVGRDGKRATLAITEIGKRRAAEMIDRERAA